VLKLIYGGVFFLFPIFLNGLALTKHGENFTFTFCEDSNSKVKNVSLFSGDPKMTDDAESYENGTEPEGCDNSELVDTGCVHVVSDVSPHNTIGYPESKLYALVLTPTRELAMQVHRHLTSAAKYTGIKVSRSPIQADSISTQRYRLSF
jgi:hypothetical protein